MIVLQMTETAVNETAGTGCIEVILAFNLLYNTSFQNNYKFKEIMIMHDILCTGKVLGGCGFLVHQGFLSGKSHDINVILQF